MCVILFAACDTAPDTDVTHSSPNGYGKIKISLAVEEPAARTVLPLTAFDKYTYIFTKTGETNGIEKKPDNDGFFVLEVGSYTAAVQAYAGTAEPYTLAASGVSPQFDVRSGSNAPVEVCLSGVTAGADGEFSYTVTYPQNAAAEIILQKWPELDSIALAPVIVTDGNGITQRLQLEPGSYLLTVLVIKDELYAGTSEAVQIYPLLSTVYTKEFVDDNFSAIAPITNVGITITPPAKGAIPETSTSGHFANGNPAINYFTASPVSWSPEDSVFLSNTTYTATLTLTATRACTFNGLSLAGINGQTAVITNNTGAAVTLSYTFPSLEDRRAVGITIKTQPAKLTYTHGESLDLTGLAVTLSYDDLTTEDVAVTDFSAKGLNTNPAQGGSMIRLTHDGQPITILHYSGLSSTTNNLIVNPKVIAFTVDPIPAQAYTGNPLEPTITVKDGTTTLTPTADYTVVYTDNTDIGTAAAVTITGAGNYAGSTGSAHFTIGLTVTIFDINGGTGTTPAAQVINIPGSVITLPDNSGFSRPGWAFDGWNTNVNGRGTNYAAGASYTPDGGVTLYARWLCIVTFNLNGATSGTTPAAQTILAGSVITLPGGTGLRKAGYIFGGWNTLANGKGTNYDADASYTPTGSVTLYAKWGYRVVFDLNGGNGTIPPAQVVPEGSDIMLPGDGRFYRTGFIFGGWSTIRAGTQNIYSANSSYTPTTDSITLYARWLCTVSFNINGGTGTTPDAQTATAGLTGSITLPYGSGFSRTGYTFDGWNTLANGTGTNYDAGASYPLTGNITLYARWVYTVTFRLNGGSGATPATEKVPAGSSITLPREGLFYRAGYSLSVWSTTDSGTGTGTSYSPGSSYTPTANVTLYARWINSSTYPCPLTANSWLHTEITSTASANSMYFTFNVTKGTTYYIWWNDSKQGNGTKSLDVKVSARLYDINKNPVATTISNVDNGWTTATSCTAWETGTLQIEVKPFNDTGYDFTRTGSFAIAYSTTNTRP
jgi:uncharacterized repeat protein (TIGR02543 family)